MDVAAAFNAIEAVWWLFVAIMVARPSFEPRRLLACERTTLVLTLVAFGLSDVIEYFTGAWWYPWWLLVMKVTCIALFVTVVVHAAIRAKRTEPTRLQNGELD